MAPAIAKPLLSDLVAQSGQVPPSHIRLVGDRPDLAMVDHESGAGIPLIDLKQLDGPERHKVVEAIGSACETDGFFMVTNHGISEEVVDGMLRVAREFFHLPESERLKCYSNDLKKVIRLSTSFNVRTEVVINWRDFLRLHRDPLESFISQWPSNPPTFSVPRFVSNGMPLKSSYNAEHGNAETIMHAPGVPRTLMLGAGTGSSSSNAVMVDLWLDSGASCHVVGNEGILRNRHDPPAGVRPLRVADGFEHEVESIGTIDIPGFKIPNVGFIRRFENLISVGQLAEDHNICTYLDKVCCILWVGQEQTLVGEGIKDRRNGLYRLTFLLVP